MGQRNAIDWTWIEATVPNDCRLVCLPRQGLWLILSMVEQLEWRATYKDGYSISDADWDVLQALVADTELQLRCDMSCADLEAAIANLDLTIGQGFDAIGDLIEVATETFQTGGGGSVTFGGSDADVPTSTTDAVNGPYPVTDLTDWDDSGTVDASEFQQYLCGAADLIIDVALDVLKWLKAVRTVEKYAAKWMSFVVQRTLSEIIPGFADDIALANLNTLADVTADLINVQVSDIDDAMAAIENSRSVLTNAIACGDNATAARVAWLAELSIALNAPSVAGLLGVAVPAGLFGLLFNGLWGRSGPSAACVCGETFDGIADYTWTNTSGSRGWIGVDVAAGLCSPDYGISGNPTGGVSMTEIINQSGESPPGGVSFYIRKIDVVVCGSGPGAAVEVVFNDLTTESMDLSGGAGTYTFVPVEQSKPARPSGGSAVRLTDPNNNHRDKQVIIYYDWE